MQLAVRLSQAGQVGRNLNKDAIFFHAAHNANHRLAGGKAGCIFTPCTQQFAQRQHNAPLGIAVFYCAEQLLPHLYPVGRRCNAGNRKAVDRQQCRNPAPHIAKRTEVFNVGHGTGDDAAALQLIEIILPAGALGGRAGKQVDCFPLFLCGAGDEKAGRPAHPGQHGNFLDSLARGGVQAFLKRHVCPPPTQ